MNKESKKEDKKLENYNNLNDLNTLKIENEKLKNDERYLKTQIQSLTLSRTENERKILALENKLSALQDLLIDYTNRQEKAQNIINSTQNLKELEKQRLKLLYKKWEDLFEDIKSRKNKVISVDEFFQMSKDFRHALKLISNGEEESEEENKSYAKSVLSKMNNEQNPKGAMTKKYVARAMTKKSGDLTASIFEEELVVSQTESEAEKFLNGKASHMPKSMGVGKEVFSIPQKEQPKEKKQGFSLEEALTPKESLSEIMSVFNLDD